MTPGNPESRVRGGGLHERAGGPELRSDAVRAGRHRLQGGAAQPTAPSHGHGHLAGILGCRRGYTRAIILGRNSLNFIIK